MTKSSRITHTQPIGNHFKSHKGQKPKDKTAQKPLLLEKTNKTRTKQKRKVKVTEISDMGFRVRVLDKDYYLSRARYNYFLDATNDEIRDVVCYWEGYLRWETLDLDLYFEALDEPDKCQRNRVFLVYARGVPRPDLSTHISKKKMMQIIKDKWGNDEELKAAYLLNLARVRQIKKYMRDKVVK